MDDTQTLTTADTASLGATLATTPVAPAPAPATDGNTLVFVIPHSSPETSIGIELGTIPAETRLDLLKSKVTDYVRNSVNQAYMRNQKANEAFTAYDEAIKADPLQTAVPKPEGAPATVDLLAVAADARKRLYEGQMRKIGDGTGKSRSEPKDPLVKLVTDAVVRELFDKMRAQDTSYKYPTAVKEVGGDGVAYLTVKIAEKVAAGADGAQLNKFMDERYIKPARMMLGQTTNKATADQSLL